jgi:hypothetical protein
MRDTKRHTMMTQLDLDSSSSAIIPEAMHREACTKPYQFNGHTRVYTKRYVISFTSSFKCVLGKDENCQDMKNYPKLFS